MKKDDIVELGLNHEPWAFPGLEMHCTHCHVYIGIAIGAWNNFCGSRGMRDKSSLERLSVLVDRRLRAIQ